MLYQLSYLGVLRTGSRQREAGRVIEARIAADKNQIRDETIDALPTGST